MEVTLASLLENVSTVVTSALAWVGDVIELVVSEPLLVIFCIGLPLVGLGVGLFRRLVG